MKKTDHNIQVPLVNVRGILLGACALGYDSAYCMYKLYLSSGFPAGKKYIEDITRGREDMNFIFEWQNNILRTSAASE